MLAECDNSMLLTGPDRTREGKGRAVSSGRQCIVAMKRAKLLQVVYKVV
jgi:hypothetical protein